MTLLQLVRRKQVWQFELFDPQLNTRMLISPRFTSFGIAQAAYEGLVTKLSKPNRGKALRRHILFHGGKMYGLGPNEIIASTEIPY